MYISQRDADHGTRNITTLMEEQTLIVVVMVTYLISSYEE